MVVLVLHLHLAGLGPATTEEEEGAKDREDNAEDDVEDVEPGVDGEEAAALAILVASLLRKVFRSNLLINVLVLITCGFVAMVKLGYDTS